MEKLCRNDPKLLVEVQSIASHVLNTIDPGGNAGRGINILPHDFISLCISGIDRGRSSGKNLQISCWMKVNIEKEMQ